MVPGRCRSDVNGATRSPHSTPLGVSPPTLEKQSNNQLKRVIFCFPNEVLVPTLRSTAWKISTANPAKLTETDFSEFTCFKTRSLPAWFGFAAFTAISLTPRP